MKSAKLLAEAENSRVVGACFVVPPRHICVVPEWEGGDPRGRTSKQNRDPETVLTANKSHKLDYKQTNKQQYKTCSPNLSVTILLYHIYLGKKIFESWFADEVQSVETLPWNRIMYRSTITTEGKRR